MHWLLAIVLRIVPASILTPIFIKKVVDSRKDDLELQAKKLSLMFLFCTVFSLIVWLNSGKPVSSVSFTILFVMGIFNSLANLCKWRAIGIGVTKSYIFFSGKDIIAMVLGYIFLAHSKIFDPTVLAGVSLILCTIFLFSVQKYQQELDGPQPGASSNRKVIGYASGFSLIWGILIFLMGYFALNKLPIEEFVLGWYGGTFVGTLGIIRVVKTNNGNKTSISKTELLHIVPLSFFVWISLVLAYLAILKSHLNIAQPVLMAGETILPCLLGIWLFKERGKLTRLEMAAVAIGFAGVVLIAIGH